LSYCARKIGSRVWAVALNNKKQNVTGPVYVAHVAFRALIESEPNLVGLVNSPTLSPSPNVKSIDIKVWLWRRVEVSCFSTTTADAIKTDKPCRAACDSTFLIGCAKYSFKLLLVFICLKYKRLLCLVRRRFRTVVLLRSVHSL